MGHKHVKDFFKRSNKRHATAQMAESDQRLLNIRRITERIKEATHIDESPLPEIDASSTPENLNAHYDIAGNCVIRRLGDFVLDFEDDPATKVN